MTSRTVTSTLVVVLGGRKELTPLFLGCAFVCTLLGWGALATLDSEPQALERIQGYFSRGFWPKAIWASLALLGAAAILTTLEKLVGSWTQRADVASLEADGQTIEHTLAEVKARVGYYMDPESLDVGRAFDVLLRGAMVLGTSDVHLTPLSDGLRVTYRVDGVLHHVLSVPPEFASRLSQRIKVLANLDAYARTPQDGNLRRRVGDISVEARVSSLPSNHGERVVLRLVRGSEAVRPLRDLGFSEPLQKRLSRALDRTQGLLFVSGPVGSGKTTTLYSTLQYVHATRGDTTSIMTLEDPIEHQLPFATQTQINAKVGMTFAKTLRSILRQDPGAIMVGEIRDHETAAIAAQAGLTGHLIVTTLHVESAAGTFARLMDMEVEPFVLSSATLGSLAQRLVRGLCPHCRRPHTPTPDELEKLSARGAPVVEGEYFEPAGCERCEGRGFDRRIVIAEFLSMSEPLVKAVAERRPTEEIHRLAVADGMVPLVQQGLRLATLGETSLAEVLRVAG